ncbi:SEN34 subunit of tRNA-splicing endonuclease [Lophium mytilinum]|uniref:tRNA-splicing endonuclease subunit Sen34 n=1 Tax=Lophium mytilinum TaxID=390894 RepID=A0A6A6QMT8_9PEZI|nr:SEN34 subunit of tRNA-splicing endonuclease [Lophium mytilinum]
MADISVPEPFPISQIANRFLIFDVDAVTYARREHNITGVLVGTIAHMSQQNVFLGIPLELMPEEARLLVEQGHAYIADDVDVHNKGFLEMNREDRLAFLQAMDKQGMDAALNNQKKAEERSEKALQRKGLARKVQENAARRASEALESSSAATPTDAEADTSLFDSPPRSASPAISQAPNGLDPFFVTPTTSYPRLPTPPISPTTPLPHVPRTYPLFAYLHSKGYFMTPGLRFGCNYTVYPGDPLRFHSHFLATGLDWDEEFDLLDIVGGGRLGTGVKKAYMIGGADTSTNDVSDKGSGRRTEDGVRAFSIEWAGL